LARIESHRDLLVWQKGMDLVVAVYDLVRPFPATERFGLSLQMTRAAASIPANIAEGYGRNSTRDYARFVSIAKGSLMELETFVMLTVRLDLVGAELVQPLLYRITELSKMLTALRAKILGH
jgi:four helix bundle protein